MFLLTVYDIRKPKFIDRSINICEVKQYGRDRQCFSISLYGNLKGASESWKEIADQSSDAATTRSAQNYLFFSELTDLVWKELDERVAR